MQKTLNKAASKKLISLFLFSFICFQSFSQKKESIKSTADYVILNKSLDRFFFYKQKRDSTDLADLILIEEKTPNNMEIKKSIKRVKKELKNDTIYIKAIADKVLYKTFFSEKARWRKEIEHNNQKYEQFKTIFSPDEIENYLEQLEVNFYLWNVKKINSGGTVIIDKKYNYTRKEAKSKEIEERDELGNILIQRSNHYFTFAKPIYSRNKNIALIAYSYNANNILYVFERINKNWIFKLVLSQNYMI